jgi:benzoate 4-monooxygenase
MSEGYVSPLAIDELTHVRRYHDVAAVLNSHDARQALHRDSSLSEEIGAGPTDKFLGHSVISLHGDEHFRRRRLESRLFTKAARGRLELEIVVPALRDLLERAAGEATDLMLISRLTLISASGAVVGIEPVQEIDIADRLRSHAENIVNAVAVDWHTDNQEEITRLGVESRDAFKREFYDPARQGPAAETAGHEGLIQLLASNPGSVPSPDVAFREAVLFLIASSTTTTNALPHAVWDLEHWLVNHPERRADLTSFAFCRRVASEALRLHPPIPSLLRRMTDPVTLPSGLELSEGEFVALDLIDSAQDSEIYGDDADLFNPERVVSKGIWPFGFTFGGGPHMCMGRTLAVGDASSDEDADAPQGVLTRLLHDLYRAGLTLDPERAPRHREATKKNEYVSFPVRFSTVAA